MSNLDRDLAEANRLGYGVWYGRYKADHPAVPVEEPEPEVEPLVKEDPNDAVCVICGMHFRKRRLTQKYCGMACSEEANRRRSKAKFERNAPIIKELTCPYCGIVFLPMNRAQKYCSRECQRGNDNEKKRMKKYQEGKT